MGLLCCSSDATVDNQNSINTAVPDYAKRLNNTQMKYLIRFQARVRGMIARKNYQKVRAEMDVRPGMQSFDPDNMTINYDNERVAVSIFSLILKAIRGQLGQFSYETSSGLKNIRSDVESRPTQILQDN